jgi:hypothetical protein
MKKGREKDRRGGRGMEENMYISERENAEKATSFLNVKKIYLLFVYC